MCIRDSSSYESVAIAFLFKEIGVKNCFTVVVSYPGCKELGVPFCPVSSYVLSSNKDKLIQERPRIHYEKHQDMLKEKNCLLYTSPSPRDLSTSRMPSSA
eukprot:TRINITY_DN22512_c0_g1_i1.p1 TRINITY_DN22512_c0_g1~~TRINITY_DN22512_c0_g1_i1.p1  ORF type:complete len:100 (+),score=18.15 TRINITY_DN22512_c0_g1_i1:133-432(+)